MLSKFLHSLFRKSETFTASAATPDIGCQASPAPRRLLPSQIASLERLHAANPAFVRKLMGFSTPSRPTAQAAPIRSGPAKVAKPAAYVAPRKTIDTAKLSRDLDDLVALAGRAVARVRAEKERAEIASLTGLDKTRAGFKAQLARNGLAAQATSTPAPNGVGGEMDAVKRSKPMPPPEAPDFVEDRLAQNNKYFSELLAQLDAEIAAADKARRIPNELLARRRRVNKEWLLANDKALGRDIRSK